MPTTTGIPPSQVQRQHWFRQWLSTNLVLTQSPKQCFYEKVMMQGCILRLPKNLSKTDITGITGQFNQLDLVSN